MSQRFSPGAARLAGVAAQALGWRPQEFWTATPSELALALALPTATGTPPSRAEIERLIERNPDG